MAYRIYFIHKIPLWIIVCIFSRHFVQRGRRGGDGVVVLVLVSFIMMMVKFRTTVNQSTEFGHVTSQSYATHDVSLKTRQELARA